MAEHSQYKIAINGVHFCTFPHRIPLHRVRFVDVSGQGAIHLIGLEGDASTPAPPMPVLPVPPFIINPPAGPQPPQGGIRVLPYDPPPAYQGPGYVPTPPPHHGSGSEFIMNEMIVIGRDGKKMIVQENIDLKKE